jgi:hypothetical protein
VLPLNRTRGLRGTQRWRWCDQMATGETPVTVSCGGARWPTTRSSFGLRDEVINGDVDLYILTDALQMVENDDGGRRWTDCPEFRRPVMKGNHKFLTTPSHPSRFLLLEWSTWWCAPPRPHDGAWGAREWRELTGPELGFPVNCRNSREREKRMKIRVFFGGGQLL